MPADVDRDDYVKTCYLTGTVTLLNDGAEVVHKAKVGKLLMQLITFPKNLKEIGSEVVCVSAPYSGQLYVVDVYNSSSEFIDQEEHQYRFFKTNNGYAELSIDGKGNMLLSVDGESEDNGQVTISVCNKSKSGKFNVQCDGDVVIESPKIFHNVGATEPMLLGQKTIDLLGELLDVLNQESAGPYTLRSKQKYVEIKNKLEDLLSEISYLK